MTYFALPLEVLYSLNRQKCYLHFHFHIIYLNAWDRPELFPALNCTKASGFGIDPLILSEDHPVFITLSQIQWQTNEQLNGSMSVSPFQMHYLSYGSAYKDSLWLICFKKTKQKTFPTDSKSKTSNATKMPWFGSEIAAESVLKNWAVLDDLNSKYCEWGGSKTQSFWSFFYLIPSFTSLQCAVLWWWNHQHSIFRRLICVPEYKLGCKKEGDESNEGGGAREDRVSFPLD